MSYEAARSKSKEILRRIVSEAKKAPKAETKSTKVIPDAIAGLIASSPYTEKVKGLFTEIFTEVLGKEVPVPEPASGSRESVVVETGYEAGMIVVPLTNPNSHNYELGEPVMVLGASAAPYAVRSDGTMGNYLPGASMYPDAVRLADESEIDSFYASLASSGAILVLPR